LRERIHGEREIRFLFPLLGDSALLSRVSNIPPYLFPFSSFFFKVFKRKEELVVLERVDIRNSQKLLADSLIVVEGRNEFSC